MQLRILGCGDAFGSGGRFNTAFLVENGDESMLVDCGATTLVALRRAGIDPNRIAAVVLSHLHGDHFGGLPFLVLDAQYTTARKRPLVVLGPPGTKARLDALMEACFPGSTEAERDFALDVREIEPGSAPIAVPEAGACLQTIAVDHPSGAPATAIRLSVGDKLLAYSGDTGWVEALVEVGRGADLFLVECYWSRPRGRVHMDYETLAQKLPGIAARRILLTHLSAEMLARTGELAWETAHDGMVVRL